MLITAAIDANEDQDVAMMDTPNAFMQMPVDADEDKRIAVKTQGQLIKISEEIDPMQCKGMVTMENDELVPCVVTWKAICGMSQSSLSFHKKLRKDLEDEGFIINPCNPCTAHKNVRGKQLVTV